MREFKFRIKLIEDEDDKEIKVLGKILKIDFERGEVNVEFPDGNCEWYEIDYEDWLQYTGFQDKNGKEIYEGYFVKFYDHALKENIIREVFWDDEQCEFSFKRSNELFHKQFSNNFEVVGNIHENPELKEG
jgi:hypothetical protein